MRDSELASFVVWSSVGVTVVLALIAGPLKLPIMLVLAPVLLWLVPMLVIGGALAVICATCAICDKTPPDKEDDE